MLELLNQLDGFEATKNIEVNISSCKPFRCMMLIFIIINYAGYHGHK